MNKLYDGSGTGMTPGASFGLSTFQEQGFNRGDGWTTGCGGIYGYSYGWGSGSGVGDESGAGAGCGYGFGFGVRSGKGDG